MNCPSSGFVPHPPDFNRTKGRSQRADSLRIGQGKRGQAHCRQKAPGVRQNHDPMTVQIGFMERNEGPEGKVRPGSGCIRPGRRGGAEPGCSKGTLRHPRRHRSAGRERAPGLTPPIPLGFAPSVFASDRSKVPNRFGRGPASPRVPCCSRAQHTCKRTSAGRVGRAPGSDSHPSRWSEYHPLRFGGIACERAVPTANHSFTKTTQINPQDSERQPLRTSTVGRSRFTPALVAPDGPGPGPGDVRR